MASDEVTLFAENALLGLSILTAIPVVMFAIWGEHFKQHLAELNEKKEKLDRSVELYRVRIAAAWMIILQLVIFFSAYPIRKDHPLAGLFITLAGLFIQGQLQFGLERQVREIEVTGSEQFRFALRAFLWVCVGSALYIGLVGFSVFAAFLISQALHLGQLAMLAVLIVGSMTGILVGLIVNFSLAPIYMRKMLPIKRLEDSKMRELVEECFNRAGLKSPELWVIQSERFRLGNAMIAGLPSGRGWFKPGLFVSSSLFETLSEAELRAVICHEVSHVALKHLKRRFLMTLAVSAGLCLLSGLMAVLAYVVIPHEFSGLVGPVGAIVAFFFAFGALRPQSYLHEMEADAHAVLELGAGLDSLVGALQKIDALNDQQERGKSLGHPETELRIRELRKKVEVKNVGKDQAA